MSEMERMKTMNERKGGNNKLLIVIGVAIIFLLVAAITIIIIVSRNKNKDYLGDTTSDQGTEIRSVIVTQENAEELMEDMTSTEFAKPGYYTVAMTTGWHFEDSTAVSYDAYVKNNADNSHNVYFDLFLEDDPDNPIYMSPVISLGAELDQISLSRELPKGEYKCVMIYHLVDDNQETVDTLHVTQTVIIEN